MKFKKGDKVRFLNENDHGTVTRAMLYCNIRWFIEKLDITRIADYEKWFAQYFRKPFFPYTFQVWQYSSSGNIDGIKGNVDYNISFVDYGNRTEESGE